MVKEEYMTPPPSPLLRSSEDTSEGMPNACMKSYEIMKQIMKVQPAATGYIDEQGSLAVHLSVENDSEMGKDLVENTSGNMNAVKRRSSMALDNLTPPTALHNGEASRNNDDDGHKVIVTLAMGFLGVACCDTLNPSSGNVIAITVSKIFRDLVVYICTAQLSMFIHLRYTNCPRVSNSPFPSVIRILMNACPLFFVVAYMSASWHNSIPREINLIMLVIGCIMLGSLFMMQISNVQLDDGPSSVKANTSHEEECPV